MEDLVHIHLDFTVSTENFRFDASVVLPFSKVAGVLTAETYRRWPCYIPEK